jgi:D-erythrulose 1-phosphate 3-epimerase
LKINFGISTGFAIKRWPDPKEWVSIVKNELELNMIQFSFDQFDPRGRSESVKRYCFLVRNECEKNDINIHSTFTGLSIYSHNLLYHPLLEGRLDGMDWFEKAFKMTKELGVTATGGPFGGMDIKSFEDIQKRDSAEKAAIESLVLLLQKAKQEHGIKFFYWEQTPVRREGTITIEETKSFIEHVNMLAGKDAAKFTLCFDVGHTTNPALNRFDQNPINWIEHLKEQISIIHLQQTDGYLDRHWPFTEEKNKIGKIKPESILDAIQRTGNDHVDLFLEIGHPFEEDDKKVLEEIRQSTTFWREACSQRGIHI